MKVVTTFPLASVTPDATDKVPRGAVPLTVKLTVTPPTTAPSLSSTVAVTMLLEVLVAKVAGAAVTVMLYSEPELALLVITTEPDTLPTAAVIVSETSVVELFEGGVKFFV